MKLILPLGPGSGTDTIARLFADRLSTRWGKPVVVENKPGGDGIIAITTFLQANDDHTLLFTATSAFTGHPYLHDKLPYDPQALIPAARVCDTLVVLAVPESLNVKTVKELVDMARAQPGKLNAASITGLLDLVFNGFLKSAKLDIAKVPYRDPVQALNDLAEGRIQMLMTSITIVRAQVQAGRVRMLALTNAKSSPIAPNIPSVVEAGFPDLNVDGLVGFFTTKDTPGVGARADRERRARRRRRRPADRATSRRRRPGRQSGLARAICRRDRRAEGARRSGRQAPGHQAGAVLRRIARRRRSGAPVLSSPDRTASFGLKKLRERT